MTKSLNTTQFHLGVCYYPEHWAEELWEDDYRRMRECGFTIIRVAEFAWSIFEPSEGEFHFELFDRALAAAHKHGLKVILGTPTATPPAWLTTKYPETLNAAQNGVLYQHGQRRHFNYNSPVYRRLAARIAQRMAEHYKDHPAVIGWQIDNELNCEMNVFYSQADHIAFRSWLQEKYGTLEQLNHAWGTVFWNQTYSDWEQVHLTRPTVSNAPNPHQSLDEKRFFSDSAISYCRLQADIIRDIVPSYQWVTHNGIFGHLDNHKLTRTTLDFMSYDSYPNISTIMPDLGDRPLLDQKWSWNLSVVRSISPHFCVMEQQSGACGWFTRLETPAPLPGQMRLWTYQSIAHGADMLLYFRWRTASIGTEMYWHGINDYSNQENRKVREAALVGKELQQIGSQIVGQRYLAEAAIIKSYDNEWDGELDSWHGPLERYSLLEWYKACVRAHIPTDALYIDEETTLEQLSSYKLLVYPHATIITATHAKLLEAYARQGGTVIFGCRSGYKDENGHCRMEPLPGPLAELCGIEVEDFTRIGPHQTTPDIRWVVDSGTELSVRAPEFNDILRITSESAQSIGHYSGGSYYEGSVAAARNTLGKGAIYYFGSAFTETAAAKLLALSGLSSPAAALMELPEQVELHRRQRPGSEQDTWFLLNYAHNSQTVVIRQQMRDLLSGKLLQGAVTMRPFDVLILTAGGEG
ncbi:beta-galactosidase [Paenibacillus algorifonticola]|uniref:Beta-galactosidase n=1 Tax=Paenibacillus algorifonticola TaxID=684063 RepID=A0A1I2H745_9BACL|nr:beta-galactosidase [Paenibacillus algorifonticola]SFF26015.1 beta-galactosidase [Paenibacillus algorifonticola]